MTTILRYSPHPADAKQYGTDRLREEFLIENIFVKEDISIIYSLVDRMITGGVSPGEGVINLDTFEELKSDYFLERREIGIINVGQSGEIIADGVTYQLDNKDALYLGRGIKNVQFRSLDDHARAKFYFNSTPAHRSYPSVLVKNENSEQSILGSSATANHRRINKMIINGLVETCQLQMGLTELLEGNVWNTMPPHTHDRRSEVYFYFDIMEGNSVCHFMGEPQETRHIWIQNDQAVISPSWSIHAGSGTSNYSFIWSMGGENLDYSDMDQVAITALR